MTIIMAIFILSTKSETQREGYSREFFDSVKA